MFAIVPFNLDKTCTMENIATMVNLQDQLNSLISDTWWSKGHRWYRAAWIESAELADNIGWKWWKKQTFELEAAQLEVVDIWHFLLSYVIQENAINKSTQDYAKLAAEDILQEFYVFIENDVNWAYEDSDDIESLIQSVEHLACCLLSSENAKEAIPLFFRILYHPALYMDIVTLASIYTKKNVLNIFRQNNGYKEGTYQKIWYGKEDNEYLDELSRNVPATLLYAELQRIYDSL